MTPSSFTNTTSVHQKHPPPRTTVCGVPVGSGGMSVAGSGNLSGGTPSLPPKSSLRFMFRFYRKVHRTARSIAPRYNQLMRYLHYDVFTDRKFEGNQLAVFHDARGLSSEQMQTITKEMNFSECTYILPAETPGTDVRMRIFTPGNELPMAGHPVVGSTFALAELGV